MIKMRASGFSLIEILVALVIISLLIASGARFLVPKPSPLAVAESTLNNIFTWAQLEALQTGKQYRIFFSIASDAPVKIAVQEYLNESRDYKDLAESSAHAAFPDGVSIASCTIAGEDQGTNLSTLWMYIFPNGTAQQAYIELAHDKSRIRLQLHPLYVIWEIV